VVSQTTVSRANADLTLVSLRALEIFLEELRGDRRSLTRMTSIAIGAKALLYCYEQTRMPLRPKVQFRPSTRPEALRLSADLPRFLAVILYLSGFLCTLSGSVVKAQEDRLTDTGPGVVQARINAAVVKIPVIDGNDIKFMRLTTAEGLSQLRLRVRDNGRGIDPKLLDGNGWSGHYGLRGMRERAEIVGGKFTLWSEIGSGTELELVIPASRAYAKPSGPQRLWSRGNNKWTKS